MTDDVKGECLHCKAKIEKVATVTGLKGVPKKAWKSKAGFYCPKSSDGWHERRGLKTGEQA
jgi:hypothetical protein